MKDLDIHFAFLQAVIIKYTESNDPVYGDIVRLSINGQVFQEVLEVGDLDRDKDYNRQRAKLFGKALQRIGLEVEKQAIYGKPGELKIKGRIVKFF